MSGQKIIWVGLLTASLLVGILYWMSKPESGTNSDDVLTLYCAAGLKPPVLELVKRFDRFKFKKWPFLSKQIIPFL